MTFVAFVKLLRLSLMTAATLLGLSVMTFVAYKVCFIMTFVANYCMTFVTVSLYVLYCYRNISDSVLSGPLVSLYVLYCYRNISDCVLSGPLVSGEHQTDIKYVIIRKKLTFPLTKYFNLFYILLYLYIYL